MIFDVFPVWKPSDEWTDNRLPCWRTRSGLVAIKIALLLNRAEADMIMAFGSALPWSPVETHCLVAFSTSAAISKYFWKCPKGEVLFWANRIKW